MLALEGFTEASEILRSGVYALCARGVVIYVGKSKAMIARIAAHRTKWIDKRKGRKASNFLPIPGLLFDQIFVLPVPAHQLDEIEALMIERYKPRYNIQLKTTAKVTVPASLTIGGKVLTFGANRPLVERRI